MEKNNSMLREKMEQWIKDEKPCVYRHGLAYRGARAKRIDYDRVRELLKNKQWNFGVGFYELGFIKFEGEEVLEFNELGENDLY